MDGWTEPVTKVLTLKGHVQDVAENSAYPPPFVPKAMRALPLPWRTATRAQIRLIHRLIVSDTLQDKEIWEHRAPMEVPALIRGDGPIAKYRRWVKQFYA